MFASMHYQVNDTFCMTGPQPWSLGNSAGKMPPPIDPLDNGAGRAGDEGGRRGQGGADDGQPGDGEQPLGNGAGGGSGGDGGAGGGGASGGGMQPRVKPPQRDQESQTDLSMLRQLSNTQAQQNAPMNNAEMNQDRQHPMPGTTNRRRQNSNGDCDGQPPQKRGC